jgi:hypothetical protein
MRSGRVIYELPKPRPNTLSALSLDPLELVDRLVLLIPPPRIHRHRYLPAPTRLLRCSQRGQGLRQAGDGVLAPNARLQAAVTARANQAVEGVVAAPHVAEAMQ